MKKTISFIVPSYNVEHCLETALNSFLVEEILENIEVIIVDDGSQDNTAEIAYQYALQYPETFRVIRKENGGHGSAINCGVQIAVGKYIKVIDADDWIVTSNLKQWIAQLEESNADVVLNPFHMINISTNKKESRHMYLENYRRTYTLEEIISNWKAFDRCITFHGITYNRLFYTKYAHKLPEKIFYEDQEYASIPCCHAVSIQPMELFIYQYMVGSAEQSVALPNQLKRIEHIKQVALRMISYSASCTGLTSCGRSFLEQKAEGVVLSFYTIAATGNPNRAEGRQWCYQLNQEIKSTSPLFYKRIRKKFRMYQIFNYLKINTEFYDKILHSKIYNALRNNHQREIK